MHSYPRTVAAIAAASLLAAFAAQANKGAHYPNTHKTDADDFRWFVTAGATYLVPSYNDLDYVDVTNTSVAGVRTATTENVQPTYNWGYMVAAGYMIREDFDVQASWTAFNSEASDSADAAGAGVTVTLPNDLEEVLGAGDSAAASSSESLTYQQFDATVGQYHEIHDNLSTRVFAGVRYAKIDLDVDNSYDFSFAASTFIDNYDSSFTGWGPEVGLDLEYKVWDMVGIVGHFAAAFLIGEQEASSSAAWDSVPTPVNVIADTETRLVPAIDAKLGLNVDFPFMDWTEAVVVEGGYQVAYYFDAVHQINPTAFTAEYENEYSDVGIMGPYLNVSARF